MNNLANQKQEKLNQWESLPNGVMNWHRMGTCMMRSLDRFLPKYYVMVLSFWYYIMMRLFWYYIMMTSFWYYVMTSYIPMIAWQTSVSLTGPGSSAYPSNVTIASSFGFSSNLYGVILNVLCFGVGGGFTFWNFTSFDFFGFNQSEAYLKNKKQLRNRNYVTEIT